MLLKDFCKLSKVIFFNEKENTSNYVNCEISKLLLPKRNCTADSKQITTQKSSIYLEGCSMSLQFCQHYFIAGVVIKGMVGNSNFNI